MANTKNKEKETSSRSYDDIRKSIINKVEAIETNENDIKDELNEAIKVLREEGKEKKLIIERLKNDFVVTNFVGKTTVYDAVNYAFANEEQKQKIEEEKKLAREKRKLLYQQVIAGGGSSQLLEQGDSSGSSNITKEEEEDIHAQRQRAKDNQIVANVRKAGKQMQKMNPEIVSEEAFTDDDDDDDDDNNSQEGTYNDDDTTLSKARHEIVMDDQDILSKIATLLSESKTFTIIVDGNLKALDIKEGPAFS